MKAIKPLKKYYVAVLNGNVDLTSISGYRKCCQNEFMKYTPKDWTWETAKKFGWRIIKVNINFELTK